MGKRSALQVICDSLPYGVIIGAVTGAAISGFNNWKREIAQEKNEILEESTQNYREEIKKYTKNIDNIDYEELAGYIESCDDPDLALYTLYDEYDKGKTYPYVTYETSKYLQYELGDSNIDSENFTIVNYLDYNDFSSIKSYYSYVKEELYDDNKNDREIKLDSLNVHVKKQTLKLENKDSK